MEGVGVLPFVSGTCRHGDVWARRGKGCHCVSRTQTACTEPRSERPSAPRLVSTSQGDGSLGARERPPELTRGGGTWGSAGWFPVCFAPEAGQERGQRADTGVGDGPHASRPKAAEPGSGEHGHRCLGQSPGCRWEWVPAHRATGRPLSRQATPVRGTGGQIALPYPCADFGDTSTQRAAERLSGRFTQPVSKH